MQPELSRKARRALDALRGLAGDDGITNASWAQIAQAAGVGRTNIAEAMRELAYAGEIIAVDKEAGVARRYKIIGRGTQETAEAKLSAKSQECSDSMTMSGKSGNPSAPVHTSPHQSAPVRTGPPLDEVRTDDEFDDDDARKKTFFAVTALLGEYGLTPPWRDILVKDIAPAIQRGIMTLDDARTICAKTQKEAEAWKQPRKIMFVRLRTRARGELQDPLPLILEMPAAGAAAQGEKTVKTYQKRQYRKGGVSRRPQVHYTEEQLKAAEERARAEIAEREARPLAERRAEIERRIASAQAMRESEYKQQLIAHYKARLSELEKSND